MWKQIVELGSKFIAIVSKTQQHDEDIKELHEEMKCVRQHIKEIN